MDLLDPTRSVTPTLDGPVLAALAAAGRPLTVGEVAEQAVRGSEIGIRRTLARLVVQGLVRATLMGRNTVHELNRDHVAAGVADLLAGLRLELWRRLRSDVAAWDAAPLLAAVFGSAARADGDLGSDIDLLLVRPPFPGEGPIGDGRQGQSLRGAEVLASATAAGMWPAIDAELWHSQVDHLHGRVRSWTGNALQVIALSVHEWLEPSESLDPLLLEVRRDGVELARSERLPPLARAGVPIG